jgi:hypothetical protein
MTPPRFISGMGGVVLLTEIQLHFFYQILKVKIANGHVELSPIR